MNGASRADSWRQDGQFRLRDVPMILMYHGVADVARTRTSCA